MKKTIFGLMAFAALLTACDPSKDSIDTPSGTIVTAEQLANGFSYTQYDLITGDVAADGNIIKFSTSPSTVVRIYTVSEEGAENDLFKGASAGTFTLAPSRGSDPNQTIYLETHGWDGSVITAQKVLNVHVSEALDPEMLAICSNSGSKTWVWDTSDGGAFWGNFGYTVGSGDSFADERNGQWWGVTSTDEFAGQQNHRGSDTVTGDDNTDAYMIFSESGLVKSYDKDGNEIRSASFAINNYDPVNKKVINDQAWSVGQLHINGGGGILWPYAINTNGYQPEDYEIVRLSYNQLILTYAAAGSGSWSEATFWRFRCDSDPQSAVSGFENDGATWTWDTEAPDGAFWGNMGYHGGTDWATSTPGKWWGVTSTEEFAGQQNHRGTDTVTGDDSTDAYMIFTPGGEVTSYNAANAEIRKGQWSIDITTADANKLGTFQTSAGSILWPYAINTNGYQPEKFELVYLTADKMALVYAADGAVDWAEATFWRFKRK